MGGFLEEGEGKKEKPRSFTSREKRGGKIRLRVLPFKEKRGILPKRERKKFGDHP